jgi:transcriptional regulator with XRE-family HTH domain
MQSEDQDGAVSVGSPQVLTEPEVRAELLRLVVELRAAREASSWTTREVAERAGMGAGALWRLEQGRNLPTFLKLSALAEALELLLEVDDGVERPRQPLEAPRWLPPGYRQRLAIVYADWPREKMEKHGRLHTVRLTLGAELWWARQVELTPALDAAAAARLLGMSPHTLKAVEFGPDWPDVASIVRAAGLTGRRLTLTPASAGRRVSPWPLPA